MVIEEDQDHRENHHAEDLENDSCVVDDRHQAHTEDAEERGAQQHERGHVALGVRVGANLRAEHIVDEGDQDQRNRSNDCGHSQHAGEEIDPPCEPRVRPVGQVLGPLVHRARDREVRADLSEVQRDDELADDDDGPAPEEEAAGQGDAEDEQREDAGRRRDVRKGNGKARVDTQGPAELLLVPKLRQVTDVSLVCLFLQGFPPQILKRTVQVGRKLPLKPRTVNGRAGRNGRTARVEAQGGPLCKDTRPISLA